jgi:glutaredoxin-like protein NrdH
MSKKKRITVYALSTCVWCKRTKRLLNDLGVAYDCIDVDLLSEEDEREARDIVERLNPEGSFPVLVIDNKEVVCGYDEDRIRKAVT